MTHRNLSACNQEDTQKNFLCTMKTKVKKDISRNNDKQVSGSNSYYLKCMQLDERLPKKKLNKIKISYTHLRKILICATFYVYRIHWVTVCRTANFWYVDGKITNKVFVYRERVVCLCFWFFFSWFPRMKILSLDFWEKQILRSNMK